ncbi:MAG: hypothetical protein Q7T80_03295 [Methanoregula sp.]|nr:hypothetical protein [Methanoregula sp.]
MMILPVAGADANIEAELGDTLNLHGLSYTGSSVYLFLTGPGLPENGVTLTDVTQRADQGKFTRIDLDSNQEWSYRWATSRIENEIKSGTYLVYVTNEPVDKAHLGGTNTYKILEVYLTPSTTSRVSSSGSGTSYTLNPEMHSSVEVPKIVITSLTPTPAPLTTPPTPLPTQEPVTSPQPTTKAPLTPAPVILAMLLGAGAAVMKKK